MVKHELIIPFAASESIERILPLFVGYPNAVNVT
jgi:hypothetical protein